MALAILLAIPWPAGAEPAIQFDERDGRLEITLGSRPLATYVWRDAKIPRPYLAHLRTPGGVQVTRNHPPIEGRDATDHAEMHPGLWLAFGDLSGADFWRNKAEVRHRSFVEGPASDERGGGFAVKNEYVSSGRTICEETCRIRFDLCQPGYVITWDSRFSGPDDFYFGDQEEMGLGIRLATPLAAKDGGQIENSAGLVNEKQVWGKQADWCDYSGNLDGRRLGILLMPDPANFRRAWFHARDYGLLVANPFGQNAFTKTDKSKVIVPKGQSLRLRFGVLVHDGPINLDAEYKNWIKAIASRD
jgi:hypothetical protein